jgi:hypothetical protein
MVFSGELGGYLQKLSNSSPVQPLLDFLEVNLFVGPKECVSI